MSLVKTPEPRPYDVAFAREITSSISLNFKIDWTGPKICLTKIIKKNKKKMERIIFIVVQAYIHNGIYAI